MNKRTRNLIPIIIVILIGISCKQGKKEVEKVKEVQIDYLNESKETFDNRMEWWRAAKFGMFIHWGVYAVPAGVYKGKQVEGIGEWIMEKGQIPIKEYEEFAKQFNPESFDADEWAKIMKNTGMKYVVITSKHHDGFALWDSNVSDYDVVDFAPYGKDILKKLSDACKKQGIKFGLYHSIMDWHHPQAQAPNYPNYNTRDSLRSNPEFPEYFEKYLKPQVKELILDYDPEILWFDGEWIPEYTHEMGLEFYRYIRSLKPNIIINNRVDKGRQGMQGMNKGNFDYAGDFGTPEQEILETASELDWESCMTMNDTWGFKANDDNWKSTEILIHNLIDVAAKGGNYLLNVGPTAEGIIPDPSVQRLKEMGKWLSVNGEAIYDTEKLKAHYKQGEHIRYTKKKGQAFYYGISLENPGNEIVFDHVKPKEGSEIFLMGSKKPLLWGFSEKEGLKIEVPKTIPESIGNSSAWVFKIEGEERLID